MDIAKFIDLGSKTFWLGLGMVAAGAYKYLGIDIPVVPDIELLNSIAPEDAMTLIKAGLALLFIKHAIAKTA